MKDQSLSYKEFDLDGNMKIISPELKVLCRRYRKNPTNAEHIMWECLRNRKLGGYKFLRQHPIGGYVADFFNYSKRVVLEIDGSIHNRLDVKEKDAIRQEFLENNGYKVIRITNSEIEYNIEKVLQRLLIEMN